MSERARWDKACALCGRKRENLEERFCDRCREQKAQREAQREEEHCRDGWNMALYYARKEAGLSQWELAKLAGVSDSTYSKCESGQMDMSEPNRTKVARVLKKPVEKLWDQPYRVRCRTCKGMFSPVRYERVCPDCRAVASRQRQAPGSNHNKIATIARMASRQGMTYGQYVAAERMERHGQNN